MSNNNKLDSALKLYFSQSEDAPDAVRAVLREKLYAAYTAQDRNWVLWLLPLSMLIASVLLLVVVNMLFGIVAAIVLGAGYYIMAMLGGAVIIVLARLQTRLPAVAAS